MAEIINPINTKQEAADLANKVTESAHKKIEQKKLKLEEVLKQIMEISPTDGGFDEFAMMLSLPEEHF
jgi:hypothetical protein